MSVPSLHQLRSPEGPRCTPIRNFGSVPTATIQSRPLLGASALTIKRDKSNISRTPRNGGVQGWRMGESDTGDQIERLSYSKCVNSQLETLDSQLTGDQARCLTPSTLSHELQSLCSEGQLDRALDVLLHMDELGTVPSVDVYRCLLKAYAKRKALRQAKRVHAHLAQHGLELSSSLGEDVVSTLLKCGAIAGATQVFYRLPRRSCFLWTAVISQSTSCGQSEEALRMYLLMQEEGVQPNAYTFVSLLKACGTVADLGQGKHIHAEAVRYKCEADSFVGNCLVNMYAKCGSIVDAHNAFDRLTEQDVVSWNALLGAYAQLGQSETALQLYEQMREEGVSPNDRTFVSLLQACGILADKEGDVDVYGRPIKVKSLEKGMSMHADARRRGWDSDIFVSSTLVSMYGKCGSIVGAQNAFDGLPQHDVVSWNALLTAYLEQGRGEKVLQLYEQMHQEGVTPDVRTVTSACQACGILAEKEDHVAVDGQATKAKSLAKGRAIHAEAHRSSYCSNVFVCNTLVSMYGKCGSIVDAQYVFDKLAQRNVVSWNSMLTAYVELEMTEKALHLYEQMQEEGVSLNDRTFVIALQACRMLAEKQEIVDGGPIRLKLLEAGKAIHRYACRRGYDADVFVGNALISMYGKCGSIADAQQVFDGLCRRNVVSWNAMLTAFVEQGHAESVLELYDRMQKEGVSLNDRTFVSALQACSMLADTEEDVMVNGRATKVESLKLGKSIHADAQAKGCDTDAFIASTLVSLYGKCGSIVDAQNVFEKLSPSDVVSWTAMIGAYVRQDQGEKALQLYIEMQGEGVTPNDITVVSILQACSSTGNAAMVRDIHHSLVSAGHSLGSFLASALIHAYGRCASMVEAKAVFDALPHADVVSWNALIASYARQGDCAASLQHYETMQLAGIKPNGVTFLSLLSACSHAGLVDEGVYLFESMNKDHFIPHEIEHYVAVVDLLGRAGCFTRVELLLSTMPMPPDQATWLCLLGACQKHGKVELAEIAFHGAVGLEPNHSAAYLLMSNVYADAGLLDRAKEVEDLRHKGCAWKVAGQSWIEHENEVHSFLVGDRKHVQHKQLYNLLSNTRGRR